MVEAKSTWPQAASDAIIALGDGLVSGGGRGRRKGHSSMKNLPISVLEC